MDGTKAEFSRLIEYKAAPQTDMALPNEFLITKESSGEFLYVVLNGNNNLIKQSLQQEIPTGLQLPELPLTVS